MDAWIAATKPGGDLLFSFSEFQNAELLAAVYNLTESAMNRKLVCMQAKRASSAHNATSSYVPKWRATHQSFNGSSKHTGSALQERTWGGIDKIQASTSKQRLRLCRMKGDRIPGRDRLHEERGCLHWDGARDGSSLSRTSSGTTPQLKRYVTYCSELGLLDYGYKLPTRRPPSLSPLERSRCHPLGGSWSRLLRQAPSSLPHRSTGLVRLPTTAPRMEPTIAATGLARIRNDLTLPGEDLTLPRLPDEVAAAGALLTLVSRPAMRSHHWVDGWLHCRYAESSTHLAELRRLQSARYGAFSATCLLAAAAVGAGILRISAGQDLLRRDCPDLLAAGDVIGDIVEVVWFRKFCDLLVYNYPALLLPHNPPEFIQPRPPTEARWYLTRGTGGLRLWLEDGSGVDRDLGLVSSKRTAARAARAAGHSVASFDPYPWLDPFAQLWNLSPPRALSATPDRPGSPALQLIADRMELDCTDDAAIGAALRRLTWRRLARLRASVSTQRLLLMKIKGTRLSGWARQLDARGCPHCAELGPAGGHTFHIMWHCPAATAVWEILLQLWQRLGIWRTDTTQSSSFLTAVFSVRLPATPVSAAPFAPVQGNRSDPDTLHALVQYVWTRQVLAGFQTIWLWRHGVADEAVPWTRAVARSAIQGWLIDALQSSAASLDAELPGAGLLRHFLRMFQRFVPLPPRPLPAPSTSSDVFVLFFDGGPRGNPGPGRAGSVVTRTDRAHNFPRLVWSAVTSLAAPTTTNNQAEYVGLITGLKAAARSAWRPLDVVGDSLLIVRQLEQYRPPKHARLRDLYKQARGLADQLGVSRRHHHLRPYNKMADAAANVAMDGRHSIQSFHPTPRPEWAGIELLLHGDFLHWRAACSA